MASRIPTVHDGILCKYIEEAAFIDPIAVESLAWYAWLERHRSFRFEHPVGTFTARKEQRSGGWYWYAYRRKDGRLRTAYLGKSAELSAVRLHFIATELTETTSPRTPPMVADSNIGRDPSTSYSHQQASITLTTPVPMPPHNLPQQLTSLVGREQETAEARALLLRPEVRLVSMVGTAGIGKTRLAIQVATGLLHDFADGIYFVPLAPIHHPNLVLPTIAQVLRLKERGNTTLADRLKAYLQHKCLLLVLDNFEQIVAAAPLLLDLLMNCPQLKLLVTSREVLHLRAEQQFIVPPLAFPDSKHLPSPDALSLYAAVELFIQRAQAVKPDLSITEATIQVIAKICTRLDGLPLAIELAAARIKLLSPEVLLSRLEHRLEILTCGGFDIPARQRTLRDTIAWSYDLLTIEEQRLFRRLSIFVGGCTLEAVETVCNVPQDLAVSVLDLLASLLDKSLIQQSTREGYEPRFHLLETIREYAFECLKRCGEIEICKASHAAYYLSLAVEAESTLRGLHQNAWPVWIAPHQVMWLDRLEQEHKNVRAALSWLLEYNEIETALRIAGALGGYWFYRGYLSEGQHFLERTLAASSTSNVHAASKMKANALYVGGWLTFWQLDMHRASVLLEEGMRLFRTLGDKRGVAACLNLMGIIKKDQGAFTTGNAMHEESLMLCREIGDQEGIADGLLTSGVLAFFRGELDQARELCEESLALCKRVGYVWGIATNLHILGWIFCSLRAYVAARRLSEESLTYFRMLGRPGYTVKALTILAYEVAALGDEVTACALLEEALTLGKEMDCPDDISCAFYGLGRLAARQNDLTKACKCYEEGVMTMQGVLTTPREAWVIASCLEGRGEIAFAQGQVEWAVCLFGAAERLRTMSGTRNPIGIEHPLYERTLAAAHAQLGKKTFTTMWVQGQHMTSEQALAAGNDIRTTIQDVLLISPFPVASTSGADLTRRELEVLRVVAKGLTNAQIAEQLIISPTTVNSYLRSIYNKLGVSSRLGAMRYAIDHALL